MRRQATNTLASALCTRSSAVCQSPHSKNAVRRSRGAAVSANSANSSANLTSVLMRPRVRHAACQSHDRWEIGHQGRVYHVNADNLPGNEVSRTFEGGQHGQASVSFFLVNNSTGQGPQL